MPRKKVLPDPNSVFHIWSRSNNKDWFQLPIAEMWDLVQDQLYLPTRAYGVEIFSFVLMNNHFHMLARFPNNNMSEFMKYFMRELSRELGRRAGKINHKFSASFGRSRISSLHYFHHAYKYIYRNPVEAGLVSRAQEWPFGTLSGKLGLIRIWIPICEDSTLFDGGVEQTLSWINQEYSTENKEALSKAMYKANFEFRKTPGRKLNPLETDRS